MHHLRHKGVAEEGHREQEKTVGEGNRQWSLEESQKQFDTLLRFPKSPAFLIEDCATHKHANLQPRGVRVCMVCALFLSKELNGRGLLCCVSFLLCGTTVFITASDGMKRWRAAASIATQNSYVRVRSFSEKNRTLCGRVSVCVIVAPSEYPEYE